MNLFRRFMAMIEAQSARTGAYETTTCPVCGREVERAVAPFGARREPGTWWPPNEAERRACCPVHGRAPYNLRSIEVENARRDGGETLR